ncbi:MAG: reverse transcriptase/maturase family protein [Nanoarchaeota archaeon]
MKTHNNLYSKIISQENLILAWQKARKGKTKKKYVIEFEKDLELNLLELREELLKQEYFPKPLVTFILRDPKTRKISKSDFRDRIVHHAVVNVLEPIFDKTFIYDSCANRKGKGTTFALQRFELFRRKVTKNFKTESFCLKADIKHYFQEVDLNILLDIIKKKIADEKVLWLIGQILNNSTINLGGSELFRGMPLGNLTSQFFANVYLNELDYFVKHTLKVKYYIRYVDDFVVLYSSKDQLEKWKIEIDNFLRDKLYLELHPDKSKIISLSRGVDFVGFRNFYHFRLLRKRNIRQILTKIKRYKNKEISKEKILECFQGWNAYAKWANTFILRKSIVKRINSK